MLTIENLRTIHKDTSSLNNALSPVMFSNSLYQSVCAVQIIHIEDMETLPRVILDLLLFPGLGSGYPPVTLLDFLLYIPSERVPKILLAVPES